MGDSEYYCLTAGQRSGLTAVTIFGFVSLIAVIYLFSAILWHAWKARRAGNARRLFEDALDIFLLSLFVADLCQALGIVLGVQWLRDGIVQTGGLCSAQGALLNIGQAGVAMASLIITLYTFCSIWWGKELRNLAYAAGIIGVCWIFLLVFAITSALVERSQPFYAPTPYWCWINSIDLGSRIGGENLWLWLAFASSVLYIPLFFWSRGYITPPADGVPWYTFDVHSADEDQVPSRISFQLIGSALAYSIPILPTSLARWIVIVHGDNKPFGKPEAQITFQAIFGLSGLVDVIIFRLTRADYSSIPKVPKRRRLSPVVTILQTLCRMSSLKTLNQKYGKNIRCRKNQALLYRCYQLTPLVSVFVSGLLSTSSTRYG